MMFWHDLASHLGMSVRRCQAEIDAHGLACWKKYREMRPFRQDLLDFGLAQVTAAIHNAFADRPSKVEDFMLTAILDGTAGRGMTDDEMHAVFRGAVGARIVKEDTPE